MMRETARERHKRTILHLLKKGELSTLEIARCLGLSKSQYLTGIIQELVEAECIKREVVLYGKREMFVYSLK